jgi:hypothetical protein
MLKKIREEKTYHKNKKSDIKEALYCMENEVMDKDE